MLFRTHKTNPKMGCVTWFCPDEYSRTILHKWERRVEEAMVLMVSGESLYNAVSRTKQVRMCSVTVNREAKKKICDEKRNRKNNNQEMEISTKAMAHEEHQDCARG